MNRMLVRRLWLVPVVLLIFFALLAGMPSLRSELQNILGVATPRQPQIQAQVRGLAVDPGAFERVSGPRPLDFPQDLGAHDNFQTEWWYYTGNLSAENGQHFGFQLTFFRRAIVGSAERVTRESLWATDQVYLSHFALTDVKAGRHYAFERFERGSAGLAGATGIPMYEVWLQDWSVKQLADELYRLEAAQEGVGIRLDLLDKKGVVLQGEGGYSQKGPDPGNASIYVSQSRLEASGILVVGDEEYVVNGLAWMDHEYSTSALSPDQIGWDWFSLQLDDGSELMVYTIRRADGSVDPFSKGTMIYPDGSTRLLRAGDFSIQVNDTWRSPHSGGVYPSSWTLTIPSEALVLAIDPHLADQEMNLSFIYWEGAVKVKGERAGQPVGGNGYVELTGYAQSLENAF